MHFSPFPFFALQPIQCTSLPSYLLRYSHYHLLQHYPLRSSTASTVRFSPFPFCTASSLRYFLYVSMPFHAALAMRSGSMRSYTLQPLPFHSLCFPALPFITASPLRYFAFRFPTASPMLSITFAALHSSLYSKIRALPFTVLHYSQSSSVQYVPLPSSSAIPAARHD